jgi:hypothetical protein
MTEKPDPDLYPEHVECPHCQKRSKVVFHFDQIKGWGAHVEKHNIVNVQCTFNARKACRITHACPASLAIVSSWELVR